MSGATSDRWAEVDLSAIRFNVAAVLDRLPAGTRLWAVVKADGYGHGALPVGRAALEAGAHGLAVSTLAEARALAGACPAERILALGGLVPDSAQEAVESGVSVVCGSRELAQALRRAADPARPLAVHLNVDTGMGRLGCAPEEAPEVARMLAGTPGLRLAGTMTHFASAESDEPFTRLQFARFQEVLLDLGVEPGMRHACNSAAALRYPEMALDAVRAGIALYGCESPGLRPALSLRARVTRVKVVAPGESAGYGRTWRAVRPTPVATLAIGYADGVLRQRSNRGWVLVRGARAPLVGAVSMDAATVEVAGAAGVEVGDIATLIGSDGDQSISAEEVAQWCDTISYQVLTSIGPRVVRAYRD